MARVGRWLDEVATPRRILWLGWVLFVIYCYPGYMSTDSVDQLAQARGTDELHDWYPPVMAIVWRVLDWIVAGPFPMLILQSATFLLGLAAILRRVTTPRRAAIVASIVLIFPPVLTPMAVIWKDSQMAGFLLAGTACLLSASRRWRIAGCVFLFFATAQRYNAPAATLPIVMLLFVWREDLRRWQRYALAAGVWLVITATAFGANSLLTQRKTHAWHGSVAVLDVVGMVRFAPKMSDAEVRMRLEGITIIPRENIQAEMRAAYTPRAWFWLVNDTGRLMDPPSTEEQREAYSLAWREMLFTYPKSYLKHRWQVFREVLALDSAKPGAEWDGFTENPAQEGFIGHRATHSKVQKKWLSMIPWLESSRLSSLPFRPWMYFLIGFVLLPLCRRHRLPFVVVSSGLLYELSFVVAAPSADYRYSHWMIVCTITGAIIVFVLRWRMGRGEPRP